MNTITFKRPELEDRKIIDEKFRMYCSKSCERTFVNVYLWARYYGVEYAIIENCVVFKSEKWGIEFTYPAGEKADVKKAIKVLVKYSKSKGQDLSLYNVTQEMFENIQEMFPEEYKIEYHRDFADYIYEREKLTTLSGKKLHGKRNHINKFKSLYTDWKYEAITRDNVEECFTMSLEWRKENQCEDDQDKVNEMAVTMNALRLHEELDLVGGLLRVNGKVVAFTLGEPICEDTFVVHIEKAFTDIQGAYPMINQLFVMNECQKYTYINREEDTGSEGLRKAKLSYRPVFLVEKGVVTPV